MNQPLSEYSHRRYNPLTGEWVQVSPHRTKRPWQGQEESAESKRRLPYEESCYLCPGNQRANGEVNPNYKSTFSFQNDFAAIQEDIEAFDYEEGLLRAKSEKGICKVICFSPRHDLTLAEMSIDQILPVIELWQEEYRDLGSHAFINHVQVFENKGEVMGCSNPHPHGQIWAQESVPVEAEKKSNHQRQYYQKKGRPLLADYVDQELSKGERILFENADMVVLVPYWAVWPFEAMILPKRSAPNILDLDGKECRSFAEAISWLTIRYDNLFETSFPYSSGIHQAPTDGALHPEWTWHMSFYPPLLRSATVKKFMVGYEMFANPQRDITPEQAADRLRALSGLHYLNRT